MADRPNIAGNRDSEINDLKIRRYIKEIMIYRCSPICT